MIDKIQIMTLIALRNESNVEKLFISNNINCAGPAYIL